MEQKKAKTAAKLTSRPINIVDLVEYQDSSVVSREIIKKKAGTVSVFAFDIGEGLSEHTAPFDAMVHILDGHAQITIAGKPFELKTGEMVIVPANNPHSLKAVTRFKMVLTMVRS